MPSNVKTIKQLTEITNRNTLLKKQIKDNLAIGQWQVEICLAPSHFTDNEFTEPLRRLVASTLQVRINKVLADSPSAFWYDSKADAIDAIHALTANLAHDGFTFAYYGGVKDALGVSHLTVDGWPYFTITLYHESQTF